MRRRCVLLQVYSFLLLTLPVQGLTTLSNATFYSVELTLIALSKAVRKYDICIVTYNSQNHLSCQKLCAHDSWVVLRVSA